MKYNKKLDEGVFLKRYKRFFADIEWHGQILVAHVPNTGSLKSANNPGQACLFSHSDNPERKLKQTLEMIKAPTGAWVGVNTATPNSIVREALQKIVISKEEPPAAWSHWKGFDLVTPECKISAASRLDFALSKKTTDKMHFIEVKNVTLAEEELALFPDAVTTRGQKHLLELMRLMEDGHTAELLFTVQRNDCEAFAPADGIDEEYGRLLRRAYDQGLKITPLVVDLSEHEVLLSSRELALRF